MWQAILDRAEYRDQLWHRLRLAALQELQPEHRANAFSPRVQSRYESPSIPAKLFSKAVVSEHAFSKSPNSAVVGFPNPRFRKVFGTCAST